MSLEDYCVGEVCDQKEHMCPIRLPLVYVNFEGVEVRTCSGDGDGGGLVASRDLVEAMR